MWADSKPDNRHIVFCTKQTAGSIAPAVCFVLFAGHDLLDCQDQDSADTSSDKNVDKNYYDDKITLKRERFITVKG